MGSCEKEGDRKCGELLPPPNKLKPCVHANVCVKECVLECVKGCV